VFLNSSNPNLGRVTATVAALASIALSRPANAYSPAGWVTQVKLRQAFTVPAGTRVARLLETSGQVPDDAYPSLSTIHRGVIYVSSGPSPTTCQIGVAGGAVTSPPITVSANSTVPVFLEDTGGAPMPGAIRNGSLISFVGIVVTAGAGGPVTVQPGSSFTLTIIPTENAVY
jgi:hypothetical protein